MTGFWVKKWFLGKNIVEAGPLRRADSQRLVNACQSLWIDYTPTGGIDQFYSDMSVLDKLGQEVKRKTIYVNEPLRYRG